MPKHRSDSTDEPPALREKKDKKDKKRKISESAPDGAEVEIVSERKKKDKKLRKSATETATSLIDSLEAEKPGSLVALDQDGDVVVAEVKDESDDDVDERGEGKKEDVVVKIDREAVLASLVPFANPLCDEKALKKVLRGVKKAKNKSLKRGVKEVVKSLRKSPPSQPTTLTSTHLPPAIIILAADISPMDVISHLPVLCEDHNIPYVYVPSRAELGAASSTKRPTSVVMIMQGAGKGEEWEEVYKELVRVVQRLGTFVKV